MGCTGDINSIISGISSFSSHGGCYIPKTYITNPCIDAASLHSFNCGTFCAAPTFKANYTPSVQDVFNTTDLGSGGDVCTGSSGQGNSGSSLHLGKAGMLMVIVSVALGIVGKF